MNIMRHACCLASSSGPSSLLAPVSPLSSVLSCAKKVLRAGRVFKRWEQKLIMTLKYGVLRLLKFVAGSRALPGLPAAVSRCPPLLYSAVVGRWKLHMRAILAAFRQHAACVAPGGV